LIADKMKRVHEALLVVMAKNPAPGRVKTRLSPPLSAAEAAGIYRCFLADRLAEMSALQGIDLALAHAPADAQADFAAFTPEPIQLLAQHGENLSEKLVNLFRNVFSRGYRFVAVIDSDTPDLSRKTMRQAFDLLAAADVVFGPCKDGGYYLIGMKQNRPELVREIPWSEDNVLAVSLKKAAGLGLETALLPRQNDIDTYEDLLDFYDRNKDKPIDRDWPGKKTMAFLRNRLQKINA